MSNTLGQTMSNTQYIGKQEKTALSRRKVVYGNASFLVNRNQAKNKLRKAHKTFPIISSRLKYQIIEYHFDRLKIEAGHVNLAESRWDNRQTLAEVLGASENNVKKAIGELYKEDILFATL